MICKHEENNTVSANCGRIDRISLKNSFVRDLYIDVSQKNKISY